MSRSFAAGGPGLSIRQLRGEVAVQQLRIAIVARLAHLS